MSDSKRATNRVVLRDILIPLCTVIMSGVLSWLIAIRANTHSAVLDSQSEALQEESPVLNRIADVAEESEMIILRFIEISRVREVRVTTYVSSIDKKVLGQDTTYTDKPVRDTTQYYIPKFIFYKSSFEKVTSDLSYVKANVDILSHATQKEVKDLLNLVDDHPIVFACEENEIAESEWIKPELYTAFINKVETINQTYLKRLKKFGLY